MRSIGVLRAHHIYRFLFAAAIVFIICAARRWDALSDPQFFAEDGTIFFHDAFQKPFGETLFVPYGGYYHLLQRLAAWLLVRTVPLTHLPLAFILFALLLAAFSLALIALPFGRDFIPYDNGRTAAAIGCALLPFQECLGKFSYNQWYLLWSMALIAAAKAPRTWSGRGVVMLWYLGCALSTGAHLFLAPILLARLIAQRKSARSELPYLALLLLINIGAAAFTVLTLDSAETVQWQTLIDDRQRIFWGLVHGLSFYGPVAPIAGNKLGLWLVQTRWLSIYCAAAIWVITAWLQLRRGTINQQLLIVLLFLPAMGFMLKTQFVADHLQIENLQIHTRYYFVSLMAGYLLVYAVLSRYTPSASYAFFAVVSLLHLTAFKIPVLNAPAAPWPAYAMQIEEGKRGSTPSRVEIPIAPPGWKLELVIEPERR